ncbi:choice-of-anchor P family protein [Nocardioides lijunqiniae]|uniref:choice-of-anchor P family protein n=1 Tax=Nocardioides lijunqiniae TaxID=2760832 RepID=UPI0018776EED|nr:choice-of-anchor P family protein [Nocardioides lijunqiniae]
MKRSLRIPSALLSVGLVAALTAATPSTAAAPAPSAAKVVKTSFALGASGFGSVARGGDIPVSSGEATAYQSIGCTNRAGVNRTNYVAEATLPGIGNVTGIRTRVWTAKRGKVVSSYSTQRIAEVVIAQGALGRLTLEGVTSQSRAFHDGSRFRTEGSSSVLKAVYKPVAGPAREVRVPSLNRPLTIPGLATIRIGVTQSRSLRNGVRVTTDGIDIRVLPTRTRTQVAFSAAKIQSGARHGTFKGYSAGVRASALANNVKVGRTPYLPMPCTGTQGRIATRDTAGVNLPGAATVNALRTQQMAKQTRRGARMWEQGSVGRIRLGNGQVVLRGVTARATVTRNAKGRLTRSATGTQIGALVVNGETQQIPSSGVIEIPGVLKIQEKVVQRLSAGVMVIGARITLLDGTGAVIDIGIANAQIRR